MHRRSIEYESSFIFPPKFIMKIKNKKASCFHCIQVHTYVDMFHRRCLLSVYPVCTRRFDKISLSTRHNNKSGKLTTPQMVINNTLHSEHAQKTWLAVSTPQHYSEVNLHLLSGIRALAYSKAHPSSE